MYFYSNDILFTASGRQCQTEQGKVPKSCREEIAAGEEGRKTTLADNVNARKPCAFVTHHTRKRFSQSV